MKLGKQILILCKDNRDESIIETAINDYKPDIREDYNIEDLDNFIHIYKSSFIPSVIRDGMTSTELFSKPAIQRVISNSYTKAMITTNSKELVEFGKLLEAVIPVETYDSIVDLQYSVLGW